MGVTPGTGTKNDINKGIEADLPPQPLAGDLYAATDTEKLFVCYSPGVWKNASPITADDLGILTFDGKKIISLPETEIPQTANGSGNTSQYTWNMSADIIPKNTPVTLSFLCTNPTTTTGTANLYVDGVLMDSQKWTAKALYESPEFTFEKAPQSVYADLPNSINTWRSGTISGKRLAVIKVISE